MARVNMGLQIIECSGVKSTELKKKIATVDAAR
jgi:hypothetical protein